MNRRWFLGKITTVAVAAGTLGAASTATSSKVANYSGLVSRHGVQILFEEGKITLVRNTTNSIRWLNGLRLEPGRILQSNGVKTTKEKALGYVGSTFQRKW